MCSHATGSPSARTYSQSHSRRNITPCHAPRPTHQAPPHTTYNTPYYTAPHCNHSHSRRFAPWRPSPDQEYCCWSRVRPTSSTGYGRMGKKKRAINQAKGRRGRSKRPGISFVSRREKPRICVLGGGGDYGMKADRLWRTLAAAGAGSRLRSSGPLGRRDMGGRICVGKL